MVHTTTHLKWRFTIDRLIPWRLRLYRHCAICFQMLLFVARGSMARRYRHTHNYKHPPPLDLDVVFFFTCDSKAKMAHPYPQKKKRENWILRKTDGPFLDGHAAVSRDEPVQQKQTTHQQGGKKNFNSATILLFFFSPLIDRVLFSLCFYV